MKTVAFFYVVVAIGTVALQQVNSSCCEPIDAKKFQHIVIRILKKPRQREYLDCGDRNASWIDENGSPVSERKQFLLVNYTRDATYSCSKKDDHIMFYFLGPSKNATIVTECSGKFGMHWRGHKPGVRPNGLKECNKAKKRTLPFCAVSHNTGCRIPWEKQKHELFLDISSHCQLRTYTFQCYFDGSRENQRKKVQIQVWKRNPTPLPTVRTPSIGETSSKFITSAASSTSTPTQARNTIAKPTVSFKEATTNSFTTASAAEDAKTLHSSAITGIAVACFAVFAVAVVFIGILYRKRLQMHIPFTNEKKEEMFTRKSLEDLSVTRTDLKNCLILTRDKIVLTKQLGQGYFGRVVKAAILDEKGGTEVAVKIARQKSEAIQSLAAEVEVWKRIGHHENIIRLIGICSDDSEPLLVVMEFADNGDLRSYLKEKRENSSQSCDNQPVISHFDMIGFGLQIAKGMRHLALKQCVHRDLAARNVLVCNGNVLKIADFGLTKDIHYVEYYRLENPGKFPIPVKWTAPEVMQDKVYTEESDVWSFGIVLWEIATLGGEPYAGIPSRALFDVLTKKNYRMKKPADCSDKLYEIMLQCWKGISEKHNRPKFHKLVTMLDTLERFPNGTN